MQTVNMHFRLTCITSILIFVAFIQAFGQEKSLLADKIYSKSALQKDFQVLRHRYEKDLANLYLYSSKPYVDRVFDSLYARISPMTAQEFYGFITPLSGLIKDGHSNIFPAKKRTNFYHKNARFFPLNIYWLNNRMFITENLSADSNIPAGAEILSINGLKSKDLMDYLFARQVRDGNNEQYALWILNHYFREYYSFHFGHPETFSLVLQNEKCNPESLEIKALGKQEIASNKALRYPQAIYKMFPFRFETDSARNAAIMTIKTWDNKLLIKQIEDAFNEIQRNHIDHLILDLRDNQGGDFMPAIYLLSCLLDEPFQYFTTLKSVAGYDNNARVLKNRGGKMLGLHKAKRHPYRGKLYVLINGGCFSNTAAFGSRVEYYKRGVFVGEETGGNKVVFSGEFKWKANTVLPNTKILCENANYQMVVTDIKENTGHGVMPTYTVKPALKDLLQQKDIVLETAYQYIQTNRR